MIDETDHRILTLLQDDARLPNAEIARRLGMAASAIHERIKKLEARGLIQAYEARLDPGPLGRKLLAFVFVRSDELPGEAEACRAERGAHGDLLQPRRGTRQEQVGDVHRGDQEHEPDGAEQHEEHRPDAARNGLVERNGNVCRVRIGEGVSPPAEDVARRSAKRFVALLEAHIAVAARDDAKEERASTLWSVELKHRPQIGRSAHG